MTKANYQRMTNIIKVFLIFAVLYCITMTCVSCESKSGRLLDQPIEKAVIIDSRTFPYWDAGKEYYRTDYKVKRIVHGVVTHIQIPGKALYEKDDTIYHRFPK